MMPKRADKHSTKKVAPTKGARMPRDRDADQRREALRSALQDARMTPAEASRLANLGNANSFYNFFSGRSKGLSAETYRKLAKVIPGATVASLQGLEHAPPALGRTVQVRIEVRANVVLPSSEMALPDQFEAPVPIDPATRANGAFGVVVRQPGADPLFPDGTILVVMPMAAQTRTLAAGRKVILQRICTGGVEVTLRELLLREGRAWLSRRSADSQCDSDIEMPWPSDGTRMWKKGEDRYGLVGVVVGAYISDI